MYVDNVSVGYGDVLSMLVYHVPRLSANIHVLNGKLYQGMATGAFCLIVFRRLEPLFWAIQQSLPNAYPISTDPSNRV